MNVAIARFADNFASNLVAVLIAARERGDELTAITIYESELATAAKALAQILGPRHAVRSRGRDFRDAPQPHLPSDVWWI